MSHVRDVMDPNPFVVAPNTEVRALAEALLARNLDGACVVENGELVGVVTTMDLVYQEKRVHIPSFIMVLDAMIPLEPLNHLRDELEKIAGRHVRDIMSDEPITVDPDAKTEIAASLMVDKHITILPVVDEGTLLGIVTKRSLLAAAYKL